MNTPDIEPCDINPDPAGTDRAAELVNDHWWPRLADRINTWWINREPLTVDVLRELAIIPPPLACVGILATFGGVLLIVWWLIAALVGLLAGIADAIGAATRTAGHTGTVQVSGAGLIRTITDPVHGYLTSHAIGLPVTGHTLWLGWLATTLGLFLLAALGSRGARIGWTLTGAITTAMVYTATPGDARPVAAGLTLTAWSVLSIVAFNRLAGSTTPPTLWLHLPARRLARTATDD